MRRRLQKTTSSTMTEDERTEFGVDRISRQGKAFRSAVSDLSDKFALRSLGEKIENHACYHCDENGKCADFPDKLRKRWIGRSIVCISQIKQGPKPGIWNFFDEDDCVVGWGECKRSCPSWSSMERVLAVTGISHTLHDEAKQKLSSELYGIRKSFWIGKELKLIKRRQKQLDRVSKAVKKLYTEITSDTDLWLFIQSVYDAQEIGLSRGPALRSNLSFESGPFGRCLAKLIHMIDYVANAPVCDQEGKLQMDYYEVRERSTFEWLVGRRLPVVFEETFGKKIAISRTKEGMPYGPYLNFVKQTLIELNIIHNGKAYTDEAIVRAWTLARRRRRRKIGSRQYIK